MKKTTLIISTIASSLEWYDFALYGYFSQSFAANFFPHSEPLAALLNTFGVFAIGFAARPAGALLFGYYGDKYGRITCLKITPLFITLTTLLLALLPSYASIGILAPVLLLALRIMQGICLGGEYTGNMVYLCELNTQRFYLLGSIASCSSSFGILLASAIAALFYSIFTNQFIDAWGWRLAFLLAVIPGVAAYWARRELVETIAFTRVLQLNQVAANPILTTIKYYWKTCLVATGIIYLHATSFYFVFMFLPNFMTKYLAQTNHATFAHNSLLMTARLLVIPLVGLIASHLGGKKMLRFSCLLFIGLSVFLFSIIIKGRLPDMYIAMAVFVLLTTLNAGIEPGLLVEHTPSHVRYTLLAFAFNLSFGLFGGLVTYISLLLIQQTGHILIPGYYLMFSAFITFLFTYCLNRQPKGDA